MKPRMLLVSPRALGLFFPVGLLACGAKEGAFPSGCPVEVFQESPSVPVTNVGPVNATCGLDVSDDDCMRTLKDQACALGADVVWGVDPPKNDLGKKVLAGRAAKKK